MTNVKKFLKTTVGKKLIVCVTAIALSLFVISHMLGNLLLLVSSDAYNNYSHTLISNPLLPVAEIGLLVAFIAHVFWAALLTIENKKAHPTGYYVTAARSGKGASWASRTMIYTGLLVLAFLVLHIITFKYGTYYSTTVHGVEMRDLYRLVNEKFGEPLFVAWYLFSLLVLGFHLSHGFASLFQTLGLASVRNQFLRKASVGFTWLLIAGFMSQPIVLFLRR